MTFPYYAVIGIPVIFVLGLAGALIPPLVASYFPNFKLTEKFYFSFFNGLAGGIILAVGYIHSIFDANESFTDALTGDSDVDTYPWAFLIAVVGTLLVFFVEELVMMYASTLSGLVHGHQGHNHGALSEQAHSSTVAVGDMHKPTNDGTFLFPHTPPLHTAF